MDNVISKKTSKESLFATDNYMSRIVEDLISILIDKKIISYEDFPKDVRTKLAHRKNLRMGLIKKEK